MGNIYIDDQHRNPNMNNKDHIVGQLTRLSSKQNESEHFSPAVQRPPWAVDIFVVQLRTPSMPLSTPHPPILCTPLCCTYRTPTLYIAHSLTLYIPDTLFPPDLLTLARCQASTYSRYSTKQQGSAHMIFFINLCKVKFEFSLYELPFGSCITFCLQHLQSNADIPYIFTDNSCNMMSTYASLTIVVDQQ